MLKGKINWTGNEAGAVSVVESKSITPAQSQRSHIALHKKVQGAIIEASVLYSYGPSSELSTAINGMESSLRELQKLI